MSHSFRCYFERIDIRLANAPWGFASINATPTALTFGPDGMLYVASGGSDAIVRHDGSTGASLGTFVSAGSGGRSRPAELIFMADGSLLLASAGSGEILRFDGANGSLLGPGSVPSGSGGLDTPTHLLIVASAVLEPSTIVSLAVGLIASGLVSVRKIKSNQRVEPESL